MYITRTIENYFRKAASQFPVMLVTGARQVGKTTLLRHLSDEKRLYVTLDDPLILRLAKEDPPLFMQRFPAPVLIDEIQYAPELLSYIKMEVDRDRKPVGSGAVICLVSQPIPLAAAITAIPVGTI